MSKRRKLLLGSLSLLAVVALVFGGYSFGRELEARAPRVVEKEYVDPWIQDIPTPEYKTGSIESKLLNRFFPTKGEMEGYVVFGLAAVDGLTAVKVDGSGQIVRVYRFDEDEGLLTDVRQLPNGNFLIQFSRNGVYEISQGGETVWYYLDGTSSHHAERLDNGNTIIVETERNRAYEITWEGKEVVWEWDARYEILGYNFQNFIGLRDYFSEDPMSNMYAEYRELMHERQDWTHINTAHRTEEGTTLLCLRNLDLIVEVNQKNEVIWTYGALTLKHPHTSTRLDNGNTLIFDNGNGRVVEVSPSHEIVWKYSGLHSPIMGGCQRLPNGTTLICESIGNGDDPPRIFLVDQEGNITWELQVSLPGLVWNRDIYRAWWYEN